MAFLAKAIKDVGRDIDKARLRATHGLVDGIAKAEPHVLGPVVNTARVVVEGAGQAALNELRPPSKSFNDSLPENGAVHINNVPVYKQVGGFDCGPTSAAMVIAHATSSHVERKPLRDAVRAKQGIADWGSKPTVLEAIIKERAGACRKATNIGLADIWNLLNEGIPIVYLTAGGRTEAHYQVIVGMDIARGILYVNCPTICATTMTFGDLRAGRVYPWTILAGVHNHGVALWVPK